MVESNNRIWLGYAVFFYGGIWGLVEASLGFLLHALGEVLPIPSLSGTILFPVGLFLMVRAMRDSGRIEAIGLTALIAAGVKAASVLLPFVSLRFVRNPVLAILLEGSVAYIVIRIADLKADRYLPLRAIALSLGWRLAFLFLNRALGLPGIASKPAALQRNFILLDGAVDGVIIILAVCAAARLAGRDGTPGDRLRFRGPIPAVIAFLAGLGGQAVFAAL